MIIIDDLENKNETKKPPLHRQARIDTKTIRIVHTKFRKRADFSFFGYAFSVFLRKITRPSDHGPPRPNKKLRPIWDRFDQFRTKTRFGTRSDQKKGRCIRKKIIRKNNRKKCTHTCTPKDVVRAGADSYLCVLMTAFKDLMHFFIRVFDPKMFVCASLSWIVLKYQREY